jgi:hypothetical protein
VSEAKWEQERKELLERLQKAEQVALESQAEAALCQDFLEDYYEAARQALGKNDLDLLSKITLSPISTGNIKQWGKLFLQAYMRDERWLRNTKQALEKIKADAEKLAIDENEVNAKLKKDIIEAAEKGLIMHI